jgi:hypothetical protein
MKVEPSRRGEVIAFVGLVMTAAIWYGQDRQDKGALLRTQEMNATLLAQRNREVDTLERRVSKLELVRNCQP